MADKRTFFGNILAIKGIVARSKNPEADVEAVGPYLADSDVLRVFFNLSLPTEWFGALRDRGFFSNPPGKEKAEGGFRYVDWPAGRYLVNVASAMPRDVAKILAGIDTDNGIVLSHILECALAMPMDVSATVVPTICAAIARGGIWVNFDKASSLCQLLASGGESESAMALAEALFETTHPLKQGDEHWRREGLKKILPSLAEAKPREFAAKLCKWLTAAIEAKGYTRKSDGFDHSYMWRPAIEEHEQNHDFDFAGTMVGFVRQALEQSIEVGGLDIAEALRLLEEHRYLVFRRLRIHLINVFADRVPELARATMINRDFLVDPSFRHEYAQLMGRRFMLLKTEQRNQWLRWIDEGPEGLDPEHFSPDEKLEMRQKISDRWRFERLYWIKEHVDQEHRAFYDRMLAEQGEPESADLNVYVRSGFVEHQSPFSVDELKAMSFKEAVDKVSSWKSDPNKPRFQSPDIEGLASTFGQYVATDVEAFSREAKLLEGRPSPYVQSYLNRMMEAAKARKAIDVSAVLGLCEWIVTQPPVGGPAAGEESDVFSERLRWARDTVAGFVMETCRANENGRPNYPLDGIRETMWRVIETLSRGPTESSIIEDTDNVNVRNFDFVALAINSPRGRAMEAAMAYMRWVANHKKGVQNVIAGGLDVMPEVRTLLEWEIAEENASFPASAVIGSNVGLLYWIDKEWLGKYADQVFDLEGIERDKKHPFGWAAWNAFLTWVQPHVEFYQLFQKQYEYAVEHVSSVDGKKSGDDLPVHHLGEHLVILYGRGQLELDSSGIVQKFLLSAPPAVRTHAIEFMGRSLQSEGGSPNEYRDVIDRFMALWDWYWPELGSKDATAASEVNMFGWWFTCRQFPDQWYLEHLEQFVKVVPVPRLNDMIVKELVRRAPTDVATAVRIVDYMARGGMDGGHVYGWRDEIKKILGLGIQAGGATKENAERLIDYVGRRGYLEFGELLPSA